MVQETGDELPARPDGVIRMWTERFNRGDHAALEALYEPDAALVGPFGIVRGATAIVDSWRSYAGSAMTVLATHALVNGPLALTHNRYTFRLPSGDVLEGCADEVVRQQDDGTWRYVLCNPLGATVVAE